MSDEKVIGRIAFGPPAGGNTRSPHIIRDDNSFFLNASEPSREARVLAAFKAELARETVSSENDEPQWRGALEWVRAALDRLEQDIP